jgi:dTDP-glucose pyrophosphorylase
MLNYSQHIVKDNDSARQALKFLDQLPVNVSRTLFVINPENQVVGSLSDGDIRRGLLNGLEISEPVNIFMHASFQFVNSNKDIVEQIKFFKDQNINLIPLLDENFKILQLLDLRITKTILPITALLMAGGRGERLKPYTDTVPKPMLLVGDKPILEHNIDRLISFGVTDIFISVKYLKDQIMDYFGDGSSKGVKITYIEENNSLGTIGALSLIKVIKNEDILVMNSDLLTNIDFEDFFNFFKDEDADMALVSIPYVVNIPYAVLETKRQIVASFTEKPTYTYYSNGGIYLLKSNLKKFCRKNAFMNATDLMDVILTNDTQKLVHYPLLNYWLDIGKHEDFIKAQEDFKHIKL